MSSIDQIGTHRHLHLKCEKCKIRDWRSVRYEQTSHKFGHFLWKCKTCNTEYVTRFHVMETDEFLGIEKV